MDAELAKKVAIPFVALVAGGCCMMKEAGRTIGKLLLYFGAQTGMNIYMKAVLSSSVVSESEGLRGVPAAFLVTAIQQVTSFVLLLVVGLCLRLTTSYKYQPKALSGSWEYFVVVVFSFSFVLNIALNNFSLSLVAISINLTIRSCTTLATCVSQWFLSKVTGGKSKDVGYMELGFMIMGTLFAAIAVWAKSQSSDSDEGESRYLGFGVIICVVSLFCGSLNLALAGVLGTSMDLNSLDTVFYMSLPAVLFLCGPIFFMPHPVSWEGYGMMTDWQVFVKVLELSPSTIGLAVLSGALAMCYNVLQYGFVQTLSATHIAFAGNFNKGATIVIALLVQLETLPEGGWGILMLLCVAGNIASFTLYNVAKSKGSESQGKYGPISEAEMPSRTPALSGQA